MKEKNTIRDSILGFALPRYGEIPNVGLYLEQCTKYIEDYLRPFHDLTITGSMISNYVKKGLITNPVRKQYDRDQIAYLIFISFAKSVLSLENIRLLMEMQKKTYDNRQAYDYFCQEFENILYYVYNVKDVLDTSVAGSDEKLMLRNTIITICHKLYLDQCFYSIGEDYAQERRPQHGAEKAPHPRRLSSGK